MALGDELLGLGLVGGEPSEPAEETVFPLGFEILGGDFGGITVTDYSPVPASNGVATVTGTLGYLGTEHALQGQSHGHSDVHPNLDNPHEMAGSSAGVATVSGDPSSTHLTFSVYVGVRVFDLELSRSGRVVKSNTEDRAPTPDPGTEAGGGWLSPRKALTTYWT